MIKDPVCGMTVNLQHAVVSIQYQGQTYYFCSQVCRSMFEHDPERYLMSEETKSE